MSKTDDWRACEACGQKFYGRDQVALVLLRDDVDYIICHNCLPFLCTYRLSSKQWKALMAAHPTNGRYVPYFLHDDFYNDEGEAYQPMFREVD